MKRTTFSGLSTWHLEVDEPDHVVVRQRFDPRAWPREARRSTLYPWLGCGGVVAIVAALMAWDAVRPLLRGYGAEWVEFLLALALFALWASPALNLLRRGQRWEARPGRLVLGGEWAAEDVDHVAFGTLQSSATADEVGVPGGVRHARFTRVVVVPRRGAPREVATFHERAAPTIRRWVGRLAKVAGVEVRRG